MGSLQGAVVGVVAVFPLVVSGLVGLAPGGGGEVAAVFPPWWGVERVVAQAGGAGSVVRMGGVSFVVVVAGADRPRLRRDGAWLLLDPVALGGCGLKQG